jgi:hypothetical protein
VRPKTERSHKVRACVESNDGALSALLDDRHTSYKHTVVFNQAAPRLDH